MTRPGGTVSRYDLTERGYATNHTSHGRIDKTGHAKPRPHQHYTTSTFNALDTAYDLLHLRPPVRPCNLPALGYKRLGGRQE
jgi:hypothetical protein